ncbi:MAG: methyltransferase domain-containing protein, partial [Candidatus Kerfeldbacteria bacterium]|nr:methyltransferase domain-containing protein [Candidatus Kerfeldbacteria bacterium]
YGGASGVADGTVDAGVLVNVLHQSKKPKDILSEVHRMLKVGAPLLIVDWRPEVEATIAPTRKARLAAEYVEGLAKSVGLAPVSRLDPSQYHWGIVVAKT